MKVEKDLDLDLDDDLEEVEDEDEQLKVDNKKEETNASTMFENCIKDYLDEFAKNDSNFKLKYSMEK